MYCVMCFSACDSDVLCHVFQCLWFRCCVSCVSVLVILVLCVMCFSACDSGVVCHVFQCLWFCLFHSRRCRCPSTKLLNFCSSTLPSSWSRWPPTKKRLVTLITRPDCRHSSAHMHRRWSTTTRPGRSGSIRTVLQCSPSQAVCPCLACALSPSRCRPLHRSHLTYVLFYTMQYFVSHKICAHFFFALEVLLLIYYMAWFSNQDRIFRPKKFVLFPETQLTLVLPDPTNFMDFILGLKFFQFNFQLLPRHASCLDHVSTKITKHIKVKWK